MLQTIKNQKIQKKMSKILKKKRKTKQLQDTAQFEQGQQFGNVQQESVGQQNGMSMQKMQPEKPQKANQASSQNKLKLGDQETVGGQSVDQSLPRPYQFLKFANPPLHTIFVPHFTVKSVTFFLSLIFIICFVVLLIYSYTKPYQNKLTWNCSIFQLQNKYYPRIRYQYQLWRIFVSLFFHSNIAHFVLNIIGLQIYGYFVEWYFGKVKYVVGLVLAGVMGFVLSCVAQPTTLSTCSSALLFVVMTLKLFFLFQYKDYKPLLTRRILIYLLYILILGINLIPIFVNNNVDYTNHIAGFITGILLGFFYYIHKKQQQQRYQKILKILSLILLAIVIIILFILMYTLPDQNNNYYALNQNIVGKCTDPNQQ